MKQTIREALEIKIREKEEARLGKLKAMRAPRLVVSGIELTLELGNLASRVKRIETFGDLVFVATENKKYRRGMGVEFTIEDGSKVYLIPGPYGLFLTAEVK